MGDLFETPPKIVGEPTPRLQYKTDKDGYVRIGAQDMAALQAWMDRIVAFSHEDWAQIESYLERLTRFISANYD